MIDKRKIRAKASSVSKNKPDEKERVRLDLDSDIVAYFRGQSRYWHQLVNAELLKVIEQQRNTR